MLMLKRCFELETEKKSEKINWSGIYFASIFPENYCDLLITEKRKSLCWLWSLESPIWRQTFMYILNAAARSTYARNKTQKNVPDTFFFLVNPNTAEKDFPEYSSPFFAEVFCWDFGKERPFKANRASLQNLEGCKNIFEVIQWLKIITYTVFFSRRWVETLLLENSSSGYGPVRKP